MWAYCPKQIAILAYVQDFGDFHTTNRAYSFLLAFSLRQGALKVRRLLNSTYQLLCILSTPGSASARQSFLLLIQSLKTLQFLRREDEKYG